jgi:type I restriction enzyme S subunit
MLPRWAVPKSWEWIRAGDVAQIVGGGTPSSKDNTNFADPGEGIPWIGPADLTGYRDTYIGRGRRDLTKKGLSESGATLMPAGAVLFSSRAPIGYCAIAANAVSTNQGFKSWICGKGLIPEYVRYYLISSVDYVDSLASGTTFREVSGKRVSAVAFPLAPTAEQRGIVAKLDALTARLAAVRTELDRVPVLAEHLRQSTVTAAFRGELTAQWRERNPRDSAPSFQEADAAYQRVAGTKRRKPAALIDWQPAIELPVGWRWASVDELVGIVQYGTSAKTSDFSDGVPVLRMGNLQRGELDGTNLKYLPVEHAEFPELLLTSDDVLFNRTNSFELVGKSAVYRGIPATASFASYLIRVRCASILPDLLVHYLNSPFGRAWAGETASQQVGQANVNGSKLKALGVPLSPQAEQLEMLRLITAAFARAARLEAEATRARALIDRLEAAILAKAFRGELVPRDPADEPASVLLDRIRAERAAAPKPKSGRRAAAAP